MKTKIFAGLFVTVIAMLVAFTFADASVALAMAPIVGVISALKLKEKRQGLVDELDSLIKLAETEKRDFTEDENTKRAKLIQDIEKLDADIDTQERTEKILAKSAGIVNKRNEEKEDKEIEKYSVVGAMRSILTKGRLEGLEAEMQEEARKELAANGHNFEGQLQIPSRVINKRSPERSNAEARTSLFASTGGGANFVQTDVNDFISALYDKNVLVDMGAKLITGLVGNVQIPVSGGASAEWEGESDANADGTPTVTSKTATPKRLGAYGLLSKSLIMQAGNYDVEALIRDDIMGAINQYLQVAAIEGAGSNDPTGILNTSGIGSVAGGTNGGAPTFDHLIKLEKEVAVDKADIGSLGFLTNPYVRAKLKQTTVDAGSGVFAWNPFLNNELLGYKAGVTTSVPNDLTKGDGSALSAIIFGNFNDLMMLQWGGFDIVIDPYSGAKTNQLNIVINSFWDIIVRRAVSFAAMKDAITA